MADASRELIRQRLARIEGQVRGLMRMVEEDRDSVDVLTQVSAIRAALEAFGSIVLSDHIEDLVGPDGVKSERLQSLKLALERFLR